MEFHGKVPVTPKTGFPPALESLIADRHNVVAREDFLQSRNAKGRIEGFSHQFSQLKRWRHGPAQAIAAYQTWVERQGFSDGKQDLHDYELIETRLSDKLTVTLVAKFSRSKNKLHMDSLGERAAELEEVRKDLEAHMQTTETLLERIYRPLCK